MNIPRRNAMDNANKNALDMIGSLQMKYNRGRQAAITNELVDIITGASGMLFVFSCPRPAVDVYCSVAL
jgi:F-type H+-transporting ATPase subunit gamma